MYHQPVMLNECIEGLQIKPCGTYVDVTFGGGGHSAQILNKLTDGRLIAFDQDQDATSNKIDDKRLTLINHNFRYLKQFLKYYQALPVDGILADLGVSSHQIDSPERGFSTRSGGELDLRMNRLQKVSARTIVNTFTEEELAGLFKKFGELANSRALANALVKSRAYGKIITFEDMKEALGRFAPKNQENKFFAQVMQALRIEVNKELDALKEMLMQASEVLKSGGRLVVLSYHSLEDRLVKNFIKTGNFEGEVKTDFFGNRNLPFRAINTKPMIPSTDEIRLNNRARSAKLRIAEKL
ncbi:MAG: 16S rRNA (cytosine(1402)-N(4))-methyltransferase RsmH [Sphingobacteriia bacterium]|nr:16S rRNA (cytosine(1402)-N(4))-methyltransferase RsmH [Sphingobacteriia bacterium]